jgi:hypothetical protein
MTREDLQRVLLADLGRNYDPNEALRYLKLLESPTQTPPIKKLEKLINDPPKGDTTLSTVYRTPYVLGEIVLAGQDTRKKHPLCNYHPVHFKKTYLQKLSRWETNPLHEAAQTHKVWSHFQEIETEPMAESELSTSKPKVPLPLGATADTFRSQLLMAKSLGSLSPIRHAGDPKNTLEQIIQARKTFGSIDKLWEGLEALNFTVNQLHKGGFLHNDLHRENMMVHNNEKEVGSPKETNKIGCLIDFETTEENERYETTLWKDETLKDKKDLIKEASLIFLCGSKSSQDKIISRNSQLFTLIQEHLVKDSLMIYLARVLKQ